LILSSLSTLKDEAAFDADNFGSLASESRFLFLREEMQ